MTKYEVNRIWEGYNPFNVLYDSIGLAMFNTPLAELLEDNSVWKSLSADSDSLQHTIASQLLQNQVSVQLSCLKGGKINEISSVETHG